MRRGISVLCTLLGSCAIGSQPTMSERTVNTFTRDGRSSAEGVPTFPDGEANKVLTINNPLPYHVNVDVACVITTDGSVDRFSYGVPAKTAVWMLAELPGRDAHVNVCTIERWARD